MVLEIKLISVNSLLFCSTNLSCFLFLNITVSDSIGVKRTETPWSLSKKEEEEEEKEKSHLWSWFEGEKFKALNSKAREENL